MRGASPTLVAYFGSKTSLYALARDSALPVVEITRHMFLMWLHSRK